MHTPPPPELLEAVRSLGGLPADELAVMRTGMADVVADESYPPRVRLHAEAIVFVIDRMPAVDPVAALLEFDALLRAVEAGEREARLSHSTQPTRPRRRRGHPRKDNP